MSSILPKLTSIIYKYRQFGFATTFDTVPVQLTAFAPGFSTGNSPVMCSFIRVVPKRHNKNQLLISRKYRTLPQNASVQHRTPLPTLHRGIPNPINRRQNT